MSPTSQPPAPHASRLRPSTPAASGPAPQLASHHSLRRRKHQAALRSATLRYAAGRCVARARSLPTGASAPPCASQLGVSNSEQRAGAKLGKWARNLRLRLHRQTADGRVARVQGLHFLLTSEVSRRINSPPVRLVPLLEETQSISYFLSCGDVRFFTTASRFAEFVT